ncbi:MAG: hypothetical protein J0M03_16410 [Acidobacteria bacterium]|nr:hypothetical protein [Acidobacteriota bacterium]
MRKNILYLTTFLLIIFSCSLTSIAIAQQQQNQVNKTTKSSKEEVKEPVKNTPVELEILSNSLAGLQSSSQLQVAELTNPELKDQELYQEYGIEGLASRQYGDFLVKVLWAKYPTQVYGLYTFYRDPIADKTDFGTEGDLDVVEGKIIFWQGTRFVQVLNEKADRSAKTTENMFKLAQALSDKITALDQKVLVAPDIELAKKLPSVIRNLPTGSLNLRTARYILGPKALAILAKRDTTHYEFYPNFGTEVAYANYNQSDGETSLLVIEHHTPQQSIAAFKRLTDYRNSLSAAEQAKLLLKREGNYIIEANNFASQQAAEKIVNGVEYGYVVKWLHQDVPIGNGRSVASEAAKTAKILVSVFGLIGVALIVAIIGGIMMGLSIFYFRRRNKVLVEAFSDAGGMMRLNLDGIASPILPGTKSDKNLLSNGQ